MKAEDDLARGELHKLPERDAIAERLKKLSYIESLSAPTHRGKRFFYRRRHVDREKPIVYWKEGKDGAEHVLLDPNTWSKDGSVSLGDFRPSWDGKLVAYTVRKNNSDEATMHVMDVASGKVSDVDVIEGAKYADASWTPKGDGFYYTWLPTDPSIATAERPGFAEVRFHKIGDDPKHDRVVHEKTGDPTTFIGAWLSSDGHFLNLTVQHGWSSSDLFIRDLRPGAKPPADAKDGWQPLAVGQRAHYSVEAYRDMLYVTTDEGAPRWRVFRVDPKKLDRKSWVEIVPERADATLDGATIIGGRLALTYLKNASSLFEIRELDGKLAREVALPGIGSIGGPSGRDDEDEAYFSFESFTVPREIQVTSMKTGETKLYSKVEVPVDPTPFTVDQVFYPSKDGTKISMFIVRRKDLVKDKSARVMLYGYGGFQINETPSFVASAYPWLERGGVYAVPNLRGGAEYGEDWHKDGMLLKKQNVFDDFIGAAEYLIKEGYTRPERLVISGGSNGGLLMGAAITQRPDLFAAALCSVPLLDMVRYHLFGSGKTWISEYGSSEDQEQFKAIYAYSPYHHVKAGEHYPAVLLLSADSDDRVDPLHARKFAAALQSASRGGPVLLRIERNAGHGGADLIKAEVEKGADRLAFALAMTSL
jgi:prolyl oligopeptidase